MHPRHVFGIPDFFFTSERIAIFIDGCFWHRCPICKRTMPTNNRRYWRQKLDLNVARARIINARLRRRGVLVVRIWEHQLQDPTSLATTVFDIQRAREKRADRL